MCARRLERAGESARGDRWEKRMSKNEREDGGREAMQFGLETGTKTSTFSLVFNDLERIRRENRSGAARETLWRRSRTARAARVGGGQEAGGGERREEDAEDRGRPETPGPACSLRRIRNERKTSGHSGVADCTKTLYGCS